MGIGTPLWVNTRYTIHTVEYKIPEILESRKVQDLALILTLCLLGGVSFGMGRLSVGATEQTSATLCESIPKQNPTQTASVQDAVPRTDERTQEVVSTEGRYVASKSGSVYHLPWCSGAKRIKEENKVWFETPEEAERAGYRPASNCKGL
jgi:hypothetical protein